MKREFYIIYPIILMLLFCLFIFHRQFGGYVIKIISPTELVVDLNNNQTADIGEYLCIDNLQTFSKNITENQAKLIQLNEINQSDAIIMGYLADKFAKDILADKNVKVRLKNKNNAKCRYADIFINEQNYADLLKSSGFAIENGKISNIEKFNKQLEYGKKQNLVILNKESGKYHKLNCEYGLKSNKYTIIPEKEAKLKFKKCKNCYLTPLKKKYSNLDYLFIHDKTPYPEKFITDKITFLLSDYTNHLKTDNKCEHILCKTLADLIDTTSDTLDITLYGWGENPEIEEALERAKSRNVKIRIVYDKRTDVNYYPETDKLIEKFENTRSDENPFQKSLTAMLMHNKFIISDNQTVLTGSMNFSNTDLSGFNANNVIIIQSENLAKYFTREFEQMYSGKFHTDKKHFDEDNSFNVGNVNIKVYFSPQDKTIEKAIIPLINDAQKYIYIPIFVITHKQMTDALLQAQKRGVDVRIILDATSIRARHSTHSYLRKSGIKLKTENYAGKIHTKSMIIDDKYVITGSMNFSNSGENKNDENCLIIESPEIAHFYKGYFEFLWKKIPDYYLTHTARPESRYSIGSCFDGIDNDYDGKIDTEDDGCKF